MRGHHGKRKHLSAATYFLTARDVFSLGAFTKMRRDEREDYFHRRLHVEPLEDRRMLSVGSLESELFSTTSATFIQNEGQWADETARYVFLGDAANVLHTDAGPIIQLFQQEEVTEAATDSQNTTVESISLAVTFDGAQQVNPMGMDQTETVYNFFLGEPANWHSSVPSYEAVAYPSLYDGIDLLTFGQRDSLKYEFHVAPSTDYQQIQISYAGSDGLSIDANGRLHVQTSFGDLVDEAPYIYQVVDGCQVEVAGQFVLVDADTYTFEVTGNYDASLELVIDPDLDWGTYLGGVGDDLSDAITTDLSGDIYVCGYTTSGTWKGPGEWISDYVADYDAFLVKLSVDGDHLWSTYFGGVLYDEASDVVTDSDGNVYVCGFTRSAGWIPAGNLDNTYNDTGDWGDGFLVKFDSEGTPDWGTYIGGTSLDGASSVALDELGDIYVCGDTASINWEVGSPPALNYDGLRDAYTIKYSSDGQQYLWSTYLGGKDQDMAWGIATDSSGGVYVCGYTRSADWGDDGQFGDTVYQGQIDGFLAKLSGSSGTTLWSNYLGGSNGEYPDPANPDERVPQEAACRVTTDTSDNVYVCGYTRSTDWSIDGVFSNSHAGLEDGYLIKYSSDGTFLFGNYLGGSASDTARGLILDDSDNIYVCGETWSTGWGLTGAWDSTYSGNADGFLIKILPSGTPAWGTYLGGTENDMALEVVLDTAGDAYVCGYTQSEAWGISGGWQTVYGGGGIYESDGFVVKLSGALIVSTLDDNNDGDYSDGHFSLREALLLAAQRPGDDVIRFKDMLCGTITLREGASQLEINSDVDIQGPGADLLTIDGGGHNRVFHVSSGVTAIISGLTITGGSAEVLYADEAGGGMLIDSATVTITNCTFLRNKAVNGGGAIQIIDVDPYIENCYFLGNNGGTHGGALSLKNASPTVANCVFVGNQADEGGVAEIRNSAAEFTNCTFTANQAAVGGVFFGDGPILVTNSILWNDVATMCGTEVYVYDDSGTPTFSYCNVQGGVNGPGFDADPVIDGGGNIDSDPLFVCTPDSGSDGLWGTLDDNYGNLHLAYGSPVINVGSNVLAVDDQGDPLTVDLDGNPRIVGMVVDVGAYEYQSTGDDVAACLTAILTLESTLIGVNGEVDTLPESAEWIDEWDTHWVEIWISTPEVDDVGIIAAEVNMAYRADCFTATAIEYGPAFTENQTGSIDAANGLIQDLGASTTLTDVGDNQFVLLARVRFDSSTASNTAGLLIATDAYLEPYACDIVLSDVQVAVVGDIAANVELGDVPETEFWPVMFDLDDDGEVGLGDLSYFAEAYNHMVGDPGIDYLYASDFDHDGEIGLGDLSHFAKAYHAQHSNTTSMLDCYFDDFPADWRVEGSLAQSLSNADEGAVGSSMAEPLIEPHAIIEATAHDQVLAEDDLMIEAASLRHQQLAWSFTLAHQQTVGQRKLAREEHTNPADELLLMFGE